jgi:hypothetical protein
VLSVIAMQSRTLRLVMHRKTIRHAMPCIA